MVRRGKETLGALPLRTLNELLRAAYGRIGLTITLTFLTIATVAPLITGYNPWVRTGVPFEPPTSSHPLGTNDIGQDLLSELIYATRVSLYIATVAAVSVTVVGGVIGILSGYFGGKVDYLLSVVIDVFLLLPSLPTMIVLAAFMGPGLTTILFVIVIISFPMIARIARSQVLSVKERGYIEAARAIGADHLRILVKHIVPNVAPILIATLTLSVADALILEAALSFLGLGDPTHKSWGTMLHWAYNSGAFGFGAWWWFIPPGLCIALSVSGFTLMGQALEEIINPRLRSI